MNLIFFDIDGTLLPEGQLKISDDVIDVLKELNSKEDNEVFICTGRCYHQAKEHINALGLDSYITSNGQEVCYKKELIYKSVYNDEQKREIVALANKFDILWGFESRENISLSNGKNVDFIKTIIEGYGFVDVDISDDLSKDIYQFWFFGDNSIVKDSIDNLSDKFKFYAWNNECLEILPGQESKYKGIQQVVNHLGGANTYAFGDGVNDMEMLSNVDYSVAMGNANDEVKSVSKFVTSDCTENGIVNGLKIVGLKE